MNEFLRSEIYFQKLGELLQQRDITGEILLTERMVLLLDIHHQEVTKDVEAYFGPGEALRECALLIAEQEGLSLSWLKSAIESCFPDRALSDGAIYPGLHIYMAPLGYMLTMALLFGDQMDANNGVVRDLGKQLGLFTATEMLSFIKTYLPAQNLPLQISEKIEHTFAA